MLILGARSPRFELTIQDYQFPGMVGARHDLDPEWLRVKANVECDDGTWEFTDPCLLTSELASLAAWLREAPVGGPQRDISFLEPNLRFEHVEEVGGDHLYIWFSQEASPPWATDEKRFGSGVPIRFPFSAIDFAAAASSVESLCKRFPEKAPRHDA
jgi:hypothetical protein